ALLHPVEDVDPVRLQERVALGQRLRGGLERRRAVVAEGPHLAPSGAGFAGPPPRSAASTRAGVIGSSRTRTPIALKTAFAIAAAVGTVAGSPSPTMPTLLIPSTIGISTTSISGQSAIPAIAY